MNEEPAMKLAELHTQNLPPQLRLFYKDVVLAMEKRSNCEEGLTPCECITVLELVKQVEMKYFERPRNNDETGFAG